MQDNGGWQRRERQPFGSAVFGGRTTQVKAGGDKVCRIRRDRESDSTSSMRNEKTLQPNNVGMS